MTAANLLNIAEEFGSPVYVYDAHKIELQYQRLATAFEKVEKLKIKQDEKAEIF